MLSYLEKARPLWMALGLVAMVACSGPSPSIKVLGLSRATSESAAEDGKLLVMFIEVVNPTAQEIRLDRFEYRLRAESWFNTRGKIPLSRAVNAGSSVVVEIPVAIDRGRLENKDHVPYVLTGQIWTREDQVERSWSVQAKGALDPRHAAGQSRLRLTFAPRT
ncbi:MAG TPA: hypothetical protein VFG83_02280 [Kofleriaceae bacterium]|nr:hypothetical protein [Kofleriaceae bacterium]